MHNGWARQEMVSVRHTTPTTSGTKLVKSVVEAIKSHAAGNEPVLHRPHHPY